MKWYMTSGERPSKRSASVLRPSGVLKTYSLETSTHGSACRSRAISSDIRVSSFSRASSSMRSSRHSSRVPVRCMCSAPSVERLELVEDAGPPGVDARPVEVGGRERDALVLEAHVGPAARGVGERHGEQRVLALPRLG